MPRLKPWFHVVTPREDLRRIDPWTHPNSR